MGGADTNALPGSALLPTGSKVPGVDGTRLWKTAVLYAGVPLLFIIYGTVNNWKLLEGAGLWPTLAFYAAHVMFTWPVTAVLTWAVWRGLRPLKPNLLVITLLGSLLGCMATFPYIDVIMNSLPASLDMPSHSGTDWGRIGGSAVRTTIIWIGVNWVFDRYLGLPRYRYADPVSDSVTASAPASELSGNRPAAHDPGNAATGPADAQPAFMQRLTRPATLPSLLAIRAEQHYIQVITEGGQELVLYRMSDAVRELPVDCGVQVHRSWWVQASAIRAINSRHKKMSVTLRNGLEVPVSAPYQALTRAVATRQGAGAADQTV